MRKTRRHVFETNSSSVHSVVVKYNREFKANLRRDDKNPNIVIAKCHDYSNAGNGEDEYVISTQQEKLEYLISWLACKNRYEYGGGIYDDWVYASILEALRKVDPDITSVRITDEDVADFDHQTAPYSCNECAVNLYNDYDICNFIFNDNIELHCYFD